jgi:hypothetical protein
MRAYAMFDYVVRAATQEESEVVHLSDHNMAKVTAQFLRKYPQFEGEKIVCRRHKRDKFADEMNDELQGCS